MKKVNLTKINETNLDVLAIIPARGGSKSFPRKNIIPLNGHPIIAYSIAAGLRAKTVNRVIVSTDDEEIADISRKYGAEVPFMRPVEFAQDDTPDFPVFEHALKWLKENENYIPDIILHLRPTSPFRPVTCVDDAVSLLINDPNADSVRGVVQSEESPYKMWKIEGKYMTPLIKNRFSEPYNMPRQKLPSVFWQTGHIDAIRYNTIIKKRSLTGDKVIPLIINHKYIVDIDNKEHLEIAEWRLNNKILKIVKPDDFLSVPENIRMIVFDFDGVFTDNKIYINDEGNEAVVCSRGDGLGIKLLKKYGIKVAVLSEETNKIVAVRCKKLGISCYQDINDKVSVLKKIISQQKITPDNVVYVGNDINDINCMSIVKWSVAVADAHPAVLKIAKWVLNKRGGDSAVRELCDLIISSIKRKEVVL